MIKSITSTVSYAESNHFTISRKKSLKNQGFPGQGLYSVIMNRISDDELMAQNPANPFRDPNGKPLSLTPSISPRSCKYSVKQCKKKLKFTIPKIATKVPRPIVAMNNEVDPMPSERRTSQSRIRLQKAVRRLSMVRQLDNSSFVVKRIKAERERCLLTGGDSKVLQAFKVYSCCLLCRAFGN
jgi:hypothetical protein